MFSTPKFTNKINKQTQNKIKVRNVFSSIRQLGITVKSPRDVEQLTHVRLCSFHIARPTVKRGNLFLLQLMSNLKINPVFQEIICTFGDQLFSTMYFGRHCGKNLLILQHDFTIILTFGDDIQWSSPELIKTVSFRGDPMKGIRIVGNGDVILLMDEKGNLWRLINAFDFSAETNECLHSLKDKCFYEWVLFKKFNFVKVLTLTEFGRGFACIGLRQNFEKKLTVLPSVDSVFEDYTFEELNTTNSASYYLLNVNIDIQYSVFKNKLSSGEETLLVSDRLSGRTYLCSRNGRFCLINQSNIFLISALHFVRKKCLALCFENGKLLFYFYNESQSNCYVYLAKKIVFVEKCCCFDSCLLWSDGISLHHTKLTFESNQHLIIPSHLKLNCAVESPVSLLRASNYGIIVTVNNIYYLISAGENFATEIKRRPKELLSRISQCSADVDKLEQKTDMLSHYLYCKDLIQKNKIKEKMEIRCEGNRLVIKSCLGLCLKEEFWKVRLKTSEQGKDLVHMVSLECDWNEGMFISVENPFEGKGRVNVSLVGYFEGKGLIFDLGVVEESDSDTQKDYLSKNLKRILRKRNLNYIK